MGKLNIARLRYMTKEEMRVLTSIELGMRNHEVVPPSLVASISGLSGSLVFKLLKDLTRHKLISYETTVYTGYRLTYHGYDCLSLKAMTNRGSLCSVGNQIGVGKESDIYVVADANEIQHALKFQRLGRTSFRAIKSKRDYLKGRSGGSWLYLSRLAAQKEYAFMTALYEAGFPVPKPVDQNRHAIVMELCAGYPLHQIHDLKNTAKSYDSLMALLLRLGNSGLIHGDFNEFNVMCDDDDVMTLIDFPQMVSTDHSNAQWYFERDVEGVRDFFKRRFGFESDTYVKFSDIKRDGHLDNLVEASGFTKVKQRELEALMQTISVSDNEAAITDDSESEEVDSTEDEDVEDDETDDSHTSKPAQEQIVINTIEIDANGKIVRRIVEQRTHGMAQKGTDTDTPTAESDRSTEVEGGAGHAEEEDIHTPTGIVQLQRGTYADSLETPTESTHSTDRISGAGVQDGSHTDEATRDATNKDTGDATDEDTGDGTDEDAMDGAEDSVAQNTNKEHRPFRDQQMAKPSHQSRPKATKTKILTAEEIRKQVAKEVTKKFKPKSKKANHQTAHKKDVRDNIKHGGEL